MSESNRTLVAGLTAAMLLSSVATALQDVQSTMALVSAVSRALQQADAALLAELVDFEARSIDGRARGTLMFDWQAADETERELERLLTCEGWVDDRPEFLEQSFLYQFRELVDPDADQGPLPGRIITQVVLKATRRGMYRDMLVISTPDHRLLDLEFGQPYYPDSNPSGPEGLQPRRFDSEQRQGVIWPPAVADYERRDARDLVHLLLYTDLPSEARRTVEFLHREPISGVAALVERLLQEQGMPTPDTIILEMLIDALAGITGRRSDFRAQPDSGTDDGTWAATNRAEIQGWARWHAHNGESFSVAPVINPISPTYAERASERAEGIGNQGSMDTPSGRLASGPIEADLPTPDTAPEPNPADKDLADGDELASGGLAAHPAEPVPPQPDSRSPTVRFSKPEAPVIGPLSPAAAALSVLKVPPPDLGEPAIVSAESLADILPEGIARALNHWAGVVDELDLRVAWSGDEEFLVLGRADEATLIASLGTLTRTRDLMEHVFPDIRSAERIEPVIVILLDLSSHERHVWRDLLDAMVVIDRLEQSKAAKLRSEPTAFYNRIRQVFVQPTRDMAGNAAAGDDEFRLHNELAHKLAACLAVERCGHLPEGLLWSLGHLAEVRLLDSVYQFNKAGFVAVGDHFDWPRQATRVLAKRSKRRSFVLARQFLDSGEPSDAIDSHLIAWACTSYLFQERPDDLTQLFRDLAELHKLARPYGGSLEYKGDPETTQATVDLRLGPQAVEAILSHLKKLD
jgi:hypothetical protein